MNKVLKITLEMAVPITAILALGNSCWNTKIIEDAGIFNRGISEHSAVAQSFLNQIDSAVDRGDNGEADRVRIELEQFEETWRRGRSILESVSALIFWSPTEIDLETRQSVSSWLADVETHPEWGLKYDALDLGHARFVAGQYDRAANVYQAALATQPENSELAISEVRALYYASIHADTNNQRDMFNQRAIDAFWESYTPEFLEKAPAYVTADPKFFEYVSLLVDESSTDDR